MLISDLTRNWLVCLACAVIGAVACHANDELVRLDGSVDKLDIVLIGSSGQIKSVDKTLKLSDYWQIRPGKLAPTSADLATDVFLRFGYLRSKAFKFAEAKGSFAWGGGNLQLPVTSLHAVLLSAANIPEADRTFRKFLSTPSKQDRLVAIGKQGAVLSISGKVLAVEDAQVAFEYEGKKREITRKKIYGIVFGSEAPKAEYKVEIVTNDGGKLAGQSMTMAKGKITLTADDQKIIVPWDVAELIRLRSPALKFLSEMSPSKDVHTPIAGPNLPWRRNRNTMNRPIMIDGERHIMGIGMHAPASLSFPLPKGTLKFAATVGLDSRFGNKGNCVFVVKVDGEQVFRQAMTGKDAARTVIIPVEGKKTISLFVEAGENFDLGDHANWGSARLIF